MRTIVAGLLVLLLSQPAAACPQPPPGEEFHCSKYDHLDGLDLPPPPPRPTPGTYMRAVGAPLPVKAGRARLLRYLLHARWNPVATVDDTQLPVRFLDGADVPDVVRRWRGVRTVILREVVAEDGAYRIVFDDEIYAVQRCRDGHRRPATCLVPIPSKIIQ